MLAGALAAPVTAQEQIVTLGDSLTFAYESSFNFDITIPFGPAYGDGFDSDEVKNWIEILSDPTYRNSHFDQGGRNDFTVAFLFDLFLRRDFNWAIPGAKIDELRAFYGGDQTITELIAASDSLTALQLLLGLSDFSDNDFDLLDLKDQLGNEAERVVLFVGGNDINGVYGDVYDGLSAGTFVADFVEDAAWIIDWALGHNPDLEFVLVNVPHVGITPLVKDRYPPDPVKTGRVTAVLDDLNGQLKALAASRGVGFADVYTPTLRLLGSDPLCVEGMGFANTGSSSGDLDFVWLAGDLSDNFHPNTNAQALIANEIIHAFNRHYEVAIAPLSATEILGGLLQKSPAEIDMPFADWSSCYGIPVDVDGDSDRDGLKAGLEFALGLDPTRDDRESVTSGLVDGSTMLELAYPQRLPASSQVTLRAMQSKDLNFAPLVPQPTEGADGLLRAKLPVTGGKGFLRLEAEVGP